MDTYGEALLGFKRGFLIIGLTGFTASGCSTSGLILRSKQKPNIPPLNELCELSGDFEKIDPVDYRKLSATWDGLPWSKFEVLEVGRIIFMFAIYQSLRLNYSKAALGIIRKLALPHKENLRGINFLVERKKDPNNTSVARQIVLAYEKTKPIYAQFRTQFSNLDNFIVNMQNFGDNIRKYGVPIPNVLTEIKPDNIFILPEIIRRLMKAYMTDSGTMNFAVDAFRNPFEVEYFKRRYREFYLVSINRNEDEIKDSLLGKLDEEEIKTLLKREKCECIEKNRENISEWVTLQDINGCKRKADYIIQNPYYPVKRNLIHLIYHLIRLVSLVKSPACIPPTKTERNMQIAVMASQNSGCLSRKVGAVVTDINGYILGVGWNDAPIGQVPCSLRTANELLQNVSNDKTFSEYERSEVFVNHIRSRNLGDSPFCFKDELAKIEKTKSSKAEFTRAVHAEENALLQAARHDLRSVTGIILYTTDSPCTLCAKKAYQLGVSKIVYINEYPGISVQQTLYTGETPVQLRVYEGATGSGYFDLLTILIPEKEMQAYYL